MHGGVVAGHQALVGVDQGVGDGAESPRVPELAGDEVQGRLAQPMGAGRVGEGVGPARPHHLLHGHARAVGPEEGLGHEGGVQAEAAGHRAGHQAQGDQGVGRRHRVQGMHVQLVLAGGGVVEGKAHGQAGIPQGPGDAVDHLVGGGDVVEAGLVGRFRGRLAVGPEAEQEELGP